LLLTWLPGLFLRRARLRLARSVIPLGAGLLLLAIAVSILVLRPERTATRSAAQQPAS